MSSLAEKRNQNRINVGLVF